MYVVSGFSPGLASCSARLPWLPQRIARTPRAGPARTPVLEHARPTVAQDRLHLTPEGQVVLELRHRWADGTTHVIFDPLERLTALTPRRRINLLLYYGVLGARSAWRARLASPDRGEC